MRALALAAALGFAGMASVMPVASVSPQVSLSQPERVSPAPTQPVKQAPAPTKQERMREQANTDGERRRVRCSYPVKNRASGERANRRWRKAKSSGRRAA